MTGCEILKAYVALLDIYIGCNGSIPKLHWAHSSGFITGYIKELHELEARRERDRKIAIAFDFGFVEDSPIILHGSGDDDLFDIPEAKVFDDPYRYYDYEADALRKAEQQKALFHFNKACKKMPVQPAKRVHRHPNRRR